jgi:SAF domain
MAVQTLTDVARASAPNGRPAVAASVIKPRRNPVYVVAGALLVVVMAAAFMWLQLRADRSVAVLAVARPVAAGQVITSADVRVVTVVPDASVRLVGAAQADSVVGRTAAVPLVAGALLSPDQVGPAAWPAAGEAVAALPLKPGRIPAGIAAGARVEVLLVAAASQPTATGTETGTPPRGARATVVEVARDVDASGTVVVSLLMRAADAGGVAAAGGEATLVLLGPAG